ncbi:MAG: GDSL-type esterase/lipase family protein [Gammaproteobacteria bacterium]|nr:GDSL-type esterase/lipase family protein [Gammaproteobacteria bacterium]
MLVTRNIGKTLGYGLLAMGILMPSSPWAQELPDPARFETVIQQFEAQDRLTPPPKGAIVLTGSSSIARWNDQAAAALAPLTVVPRGFGGSIMRDVLHYLDRVALAYEPRAILIYEGDNDTKPGAVLPRQLVLEQLQQIIDRVHETLPETRVYVLAVKPSVSRWSVWPDAQELSAGYARIAQNDPLVYYVDVATPLLNDDGSVRDDIFVEDMLHLNDAGNEIWGRTIKAALMPIEAQFETEQQ